MSSTRPRINRGRLISMIDYKWRTDRLPFEDIVVPMDYLPDPDAEHTLNYVGGHGSAAFNGASADGGFPFRNGHQETLKDLEKKWPDLALYRIVSAGGSSKPRTVLPPGVKSQPPAQTDAGTSSSTTSVLPSNPPQ